MATLDELAIAGELHKVRPEAVLGNDQQAFRQMYLSPSVYTWIKSTLPNLSTDGHVDGALTPRDQAMTCLQDFISGQPPKNFEKPPTRLRPERLGVWEFRTADLRLFGVFPMRDTFIWVTCCTKSQAIRNKNEGYWLRQDETLKFINALELDDPKMLHGEIEDVITI